MAWIQAASIRAYEGLQMSEFPMQPENLASFRLLRTKLFVPRSHPEIVERPWLDQRLDEGTNYEGNHFMRTSRLRENHLAQSLDQVIQKTCGMVLH
jgi:hypothetical protein